MKFHEDFQEAPISMWSEALFAVEAALLHAAPVYYGFGVPRGDGSAVVVIPGFLGTDLFLTEMFHWLRRIGYTPYFSGIGLNAECPNLLIKRRLTATIDRALKETGRPIHIVGHSLGGIIARSAAAQRPADVASVITLGAPFRGTVVHAGVLKAARVVRDMIVREHGDAVLPDCYTGRCTCNFLDSLRRDLPAGIAETAIFTRHDGIVDWRYCITGNPAVDFEVTGTHLGLAFNSNVYSLIAQRLEWSRSEKPKQRPRRRRSTARVAVPEAPAVVQPAPAVR